MKVHFDVVCLSHLRWDFVYQRPQHLLSRCAKSHRVFFVEEPVYDSDTPKICTSERSGGVTVAVPHLPPGTEFERAEQLQRHLLAKLFDENGLDRYVLWFYTPMAIGLTSGLTPMAVVYDCMDELSAFRGAPKLLRDRETELFRSADLVFTGGQSLYEAKRDRHPAVFAFPSSVDVQHFSGGIGSDDPPDQAEIAHPRIGFYGVIDERMDLDLVAEAAQLKSDFNWILVGPVVKIDPANLPQAPNIHYLGPKQYSELPEYVTNWDVAMMPFALNESTRFISPTKTPEYLAAGKPVVSTSIRDVVRPYKNLGLAKIADTPADFTQAVEDALLEDSAGRQKRAKEFLADNSWDKTWSRMDELIQAAVDRHIA